ncbi:DoxX family protein [Chryseobacterium sp. HR92]|uniref:DoxX family protein n=1 Tax=Chryseobacterium sp. HR92 TaxID=3094839 RepID=UPI00388FFEC5|nr:DoxX family protein [Chryseobacterium sp. HR92]
MIILTKKTNTDLGILILRISIGVLMLFHGIFKLIHGFDFIKSVLLEHGLPQFLWLGILVMEVIAPILLILGIFTRFSGLGITLLMTFSIYLARLSEAFTLNQFGGLGGELNFLFLFGGLSLFFTGGGKYSLYKPSNDWIK